MKSYEGLCRQAREGVYDAKVCCGLAMRLCREDMQKGDAYAKEFMNSCFACQKTIQALTLMEQSSSLIPVQDSVTGQLYTLPRNSHNLC